MNKLTIKTREELDKMKEGGKRLGKIKTKLREIVVEGARASDIEDLAVKLINKYGGTASFKRVPNYYWATCVNVNQGLVHGIPTKDVIFREGDVVSVDMGFYYQGFHSDASFSKGINPTPEVKRFLKVGEDTFEKVVKKVKPGNYISDISGEIEKEIGKEGYFPIKALVGHGIGRNLHEEPSIPCFVNSGQKDLKIVPGMALAIELMYSMGSPEVVMDKDGWTISMRDGKISALYEETVAVYADGPLVLTRG